jgi:hypothetical protein
VHTDRSSNEEEATITPIAYEHWSTGDASIGTETLISYCLLLVYIELAHASSTFLLFVVAVFVPFKSLLKFICLCFIIYGFHVVIMKKCHAQSVTIYHSKF